MAALVQVEQTGVEENGSRAGRFARVLALVLSCVLTGCVTLAPQTPDPDVVIPTDWALSETQAVSADITSYWRLLDDPLLTRYVQRAIIANRELAQGVARLDQASAQLDAARAGYAPSINASGTATRDIGDFARDGVLFNLGADAAWEADLFGRIGGNVAASRADLVATGFSLADLQRLIVGQVALATIDARSLAEQLAIARDTLAIQDDNLEIAGFRVQAGLVSSLDVEQARVQRAQTAASIPALENALAATANSISTLIGEPPGEVLAELTLVAPAPVPEPATLAGLAPPAQVLRRRPDVRSAEAALVASGARVGLARAQLYPLVRLSGNLGAGPATAGNLFDIITGGLFGSIGQLIFDGGRTRAQIDGAQAAARGALAAWEQSILIALQEVESASVARRTADERVAINGEAVDAASASALLARNQYQAGLTDFRNLLFAESDLLLARNQLVSTRADRASAFVRLTQALGGGWLADDFVPLDPAATRGSDPEQ